MSRKRDECISIIEHLYPVDSEHDDTAKVGRELLEQAKMDTLDWRNECDEVLQRYAALCLATESEEIRARMS